MATQGGPALTRRSIGRKLYASPRQFGARGDGITDDTIAVQAALNQGFAAGRVVRIEAGTYLVGQLDIQAGMTIEGEGSLSVLKLLPNSTKFQRIFTTFNSLYDGAADSDVLGITRLTFDMNRVNQGAYLASEKEQQHAIFLAAAGNSGGRLRARITDCMFREGCADGVALYSNVDAVVADSFFWNLFRSSVSILGGYNKLRVSNCRGAGDVHKSCFQAEVQPATGSYLNALTLDLNMVNCDWAHGLDIGVGGGSHIYIENSNFGEGCCAYVGNIEQNPALPRSTFTFVGGSLVIAGASGAYRFYRYGDCKFVGTRFTWANATSHTSMIQPDPAFTNQSIQFNDCDFDGDASYHTATPVAAASAAWAAGLLTIDTAAPHGLIAGGFVLLENWTTSAVNGLYRVESPVADADTFAVVMPRNPGAVTIGSGTTRLRTGLFAMSSSADLLASNNRVTMNNCRYGARVDVCHYQGQGGKLSLRNLHTEAGMLAYVGSGATYLFETRIGQFTFGSQFRQCAHVLGGIAGCILWHESVHVPVEVSGFSRSTNLTGLTMRGNRVIYGDGVPATSDPSFKGDEYVRTDPAGSATYKFVAVTAAQSGAASSWKIASTLAA